MLVFCSSTGTGKTSCLQAFAQAKLDFLPERSIYVDLRDEQEDVYPRFVRSLGFPYEILQEDADMVVDDLLDALTGNVGGVTELAQSYEGFVRSLNPVTRTQLSVGDTWNAVFGSFREQFEKFGERVAFPCGSGDDVNDDSSIVNQLAQPIPSDDASVLSEASAPNGPGRIFRVGFPEGISADCFKLARADMADIRPIAVLCIDNVPKLDIKLFGFFANLKEHKETAEKLCKLNNNEKVTLVEGSYTGDPLDTAQELTYNNFDWSSDDLLQHLKTKYYDLLENDDVQRVLEEAAPTPSVRTAEYHAYTKLRELPNVKL